MKKAVGIIDGDLNADARVAADDCLIHCFVAFHIANDVEGIRICQSVDQFTALPTVVRVEDHGVDLADVRVDAEAEEHHLQNGNDQRKEQRREIAAHVQHLFIKDCAKAAEGVRHQRPPAKSDVERRVRRIHLRGWA